MVKKPTYEELALRIKQQDEELAERKRLEKKWVQVINSVDEWYALLNSDLNIIDINTPCRKIFYPKLDKKDVIGKKFSDLAADIKLRYQKIKDVLKTGKPYAEEDIVTSPRISKQKYHINIKAVKIGNGIGIVAKDVTEQRIVETALRESEEQYRLVFDNAGPITAITYFDTDLKIIKANNNLLYEVGDDFENLEGMDMGMLFRRLPKEQREMILERNKKIIREGKGAVFEDLVEFNKGKQWYYSVTEPVKDSNGKVIGIVVFAYNITDRKKMEEELKKKNIELEESNIALKVLLKKRDEDRHEQEEKVLNNIKSLIVPYLEKMKSGKLSKRQESHLEIIENNINEVVSPFIHDISSGFYNLSPTEIQISNLIMQGLSTKEIADIMSLSDKTIESHRKRIRKKIGIINKKVNLRTHLLSIQNG